MSDKLTQDLNSKDSSERGLSLLISKIKQQWHLANPEAYKELGEKEADKLAKLAAQAHAETREALILNKGLDWWTAEEIASEAWRWPDVEEPEDEELRAMWNPRLIYSAANLEE